MKREIRAITTDDVELRTVTREDGTEDTWLRYTAPPWESWSVDLGGFREKIARGAFKESGEEVISTFQHDQGALLGRQSAKTLKLEDTKAGLVSEVLLNPETSIGRDVLGHAKRKDIKGASFEFTVLGDEWNEELTERTVTKGVLYQTGPVTNPAYETNDVELACRSRDRARARREAASKDEVFEARERLARVGVLYSD